MVHQKRHCWRVGVVRVLVVIMCNNVNHQVAVFAMRNDKLRSDRVRVRGHARSDNLLDRSPRSFFARDGSKGINLLVQAVKALFNQGRKEQVAFSHFQFILSC